MLIKAWTQTIEKLIKNKQAPPDSFIALLSTEILYLSMRTTIKEDDTYSSLEIPVPAQKYRIFTKPLDNIEARKKVIYLVNNFSGLTSLKIDNTIGHPTERIKKIIQDVSDCITEYTKENSEIESAELIKLSAEFRSSDGKGLSGISVPPFLLSSLKHSLSKEFDAEIKKTVKESEKMSKPTGKKKKSQKTKKIIAGIVAICIVAAAGAFAVSKLAEKNAAQPEITTTYMTEEVSYGDVDTTISGSGNLTPVTNEMLSCENPCTVDEINVAVGDTVSEGDVIAVVTEKITETVMNEETREMAEEVTEEEVEITAPCDGIVTELPVSAGDDIEAGGEIAIVMGTDGFKLNLSVDELDIANVQIGQEVTVTVDAVNGEYTGEVSNLSYNGSSSGSSTSYQITASIDYAEGIYSGMSASAEIVIESSGEGLLVPVDAVRTSGDDSYVYLAPSDAENGTEYSQEELSLDDLTKCVVETGMSDGTYIMIESDELSEGSLIIITEVSTTATGSDSEISEGFGGMGGFGGMRGGPGGEMPEGFDFGDFDPANMPQGGGGFGGFGGGMPGMN